MRQLGFQTKKAQGFTFVELVAVLLVVGIVAGVSIGPLIESRAFDGKRALDSLLSVTRSTQQTALVQSSVILKIETTGVSVVFSEVISGATGTTRSFPANEVAITAGSVGSGTTCGSISSTITLNFDSAGEIEAVDDDGFPICLNGESSLCISPAGFAHQGACL